MSHIIIRAGETLLLLLLLLLFLVVVVFRVDKATPSRRRRRRRAGVGRHLYREFFHPQKKTKFDRRTKTLLSLSHLGYRLFSAFFFREDGGGKNLNKHKEGAKERRGNKSEKTTLIIVADRRDPSSSKREVTTLRSIEKSIRVETQSEKYKRNEFFVFDVLVFGADHVRVLQ